MIFKTSRDVLRMGHWLSLSLFMFLSSEALALHWFEFEVDNKKLLGIFIDNYGKRASSTNGGKLPIPPEKADLANEVRSKRTKYSEYFLAKAYWEHFLAHVPKKDRSALFKERARGLAAGTANLEDLMPERSRSLLLLDQTSPELKTVGFYQSIWTTPSQMNGDELFFFDKSDLERSYRGSSTGSELSSIQDIRFLRYLFVDPNVRVAPYLMYNLAFRLGVIGNSRHKNTPLGFLTEIENTNPKNNLFVLEAFGEVENKLANDGFESILMKQHNKSQVRLYISPEREYFRRIQLLRENKVWQKIDQALLGSKVHFYGNNIDGLSFADIGRFDSILAFHFTDSCSQGISLGNMMGMRHGLIPFPKKN